MVGSFIFFIFISISIINSLLLLYTFLFFIFSENIAYIIYSLVNKQDANGHVYNDVLTEAALMGFNGAEWAKTSGLIVSKVEVDKLNDFFKQKDQTAFHLLT